ncbi:cell division cycle and apoptosis regulator protein 1-like isoform X2 [Phlebotomus argentipes]|uniref:cell division cycle and apoptosis regulator protein 1-like isoform X2 n=1 Tax=Phlebotomus argentipes TaxID=94469 RepID=UPI002892F7D2|nr:cell division cycle and apoptosis regulator protein 1-like isoform X2 [Phlebotomus argentipes]
MSYDGQKTPSCPPPPPWQRNSINQAGQQISNLQTHLGLANQALVTYAQNQPVYNTNIAMAQQQGGQQQQNLSLISQISGSLASQLPTNQIFTQSVSYPTSRTLNPIAFSQQPAGTQHSQQTLPLGQTPASLAKSHGVFNGIGVVTKMQGDIGFIDKEVFFNKNVCAKGCFPKVGDRVLVEVTYNQKMPFKWNATRVQVVSTTGSSSMQSQNRSMMSITHKSSSYSSGSPSENGSNYSRNMSRSRRATPSPPRISDRHSTSSRDPRLRESDTRHEEDEKRRRRHSREKERYRERRDSTPERRERSPPRRSSPPRKKRTRVIPRYMVQVPRVCLTVKEADVLALKRRYNNLYIPSDFFYTNVKWSDAFPPNAPFSIHKPCSFHIMNKDVEPVVCGELPAEPADVDYLFSAKVMLMGCPPIDEMYSKCITMAEDKEKDDDRDVVHPSRLINFLVGVRGKNEAMAIGGPWSPSMDGESPQSDVSVLIRTAIRNCKSLTGIDLSNCTQWYRFVELYYRRGEVVQKGRIVPPRIETVVIFLPDVRSCIPTRLEWDALHGKYRHTLDRILLQEDDLPSDGESLATSGVDAGVVVPKAESPDDDAAKERAESADAVKEEKSAAEESSNEKATEAAAQVPAASEKQPEEQTVADDGAVATEKDETAEADVVPEQEPTHHSNLDPKTMKIQELRDELSARNISAKGLKSQLALRLAKALKVEMETEANEAEKVAVSEGKEVTEESEVVEALKENEEPMEVEKTKESEQVLGAEEQAEDVENAEKVENSKNAEQPEGEDAVQSEKVTNSEEKMETEESEQAGGVQTQTEKKGEIAKKRECSQEAEDTLFNESDMADMVVIDEVGGSKANEKPPEEKPKKVEKKPLDEREKQALEKKYTLPESPQIIVHPSKQAKGGKFDCTIMSLSVLLDYRPEDTKEHTFEVSLFAELFNEMMMRDFGFNIYKALNLVPEKNKDADVKKDDKKIDTVTIEDSPAKESAKESSKKSSDDKEAKEKDKDDDESKNKKSDRDKSERSKHYDDSDDDSVSVKSGEKRKREKDRQKFYTASPDLLLSFVYFDQSHCGYIYEKDVEDLFHTLGLDLSRAQIRKLVGKTISRDSLQYRKLTDQVKEEKSETTEEVVKQENLEDTLTDDVIKGNKMYLPVFRDVLKSLNSTDEPPLKRVKTEAAEEVTVGQESSGFVMHNGGIVDVEKMLGQMSRSEKALEDTEKLLVDMRKQIAELQASNSKANNKIKDLSSDLRSVNRKLTDTEQILNSTQKRCNDYYAILSTVNEKVSPVFAKSERSEKSHRSDSRSREPRERDRESKESSKSETTKKDE